AFQGAAVLAVPAVRSLMASPVALAGDQDLLAGSALLLETLLQLSRTKDSHAWTPAELKKKAAPGLQGPLEEAVRRRIETHSLPAAVGCLLQKKKWLVFLMGDVVGGSPWQPGAAPGVQPAEPFHFARAFDEAFERLEKQPGAHNFVNL